MARRLSPRLVFLSAVAGVLLGLTGCATQRSVRIHTDPPGARVWINGVEQAGRSPVDVPFVHYGRLEIRVEKAGYQPVAQDLDLPSQIDGYPVVDLPFEVLVPERRFAHHIRLSPLPPSPSREDARTVLERARALRDEAHRVSRPGQ